MTLDEDIYDLCKQNINVENKNRTDITGKSDSYILDSVFFDWENSYKSDYYNLTRIEMTSLSNLFLNSDMTALKHNRPDIFSQNGINDIYRNVIHVLYNASLKTIKIKSKKSHNKYWWDSPLNEEKRESKEQFGLWCNAGKPKSGPIYEKNVPLAKNIAMQYIKENLSPKIMLVKNCKII